MHCSMATTTTARECPMCLDKLRKPVITPCGKPCAHSNVYTLILAYSHESRHLTCHPCMKMHARRSNDTYQATSHVIPLSSSVVEGTIVQAETKRRVERAQRGCRKFEQWRIWKCSTLCSVLFRRVSVPLHCVLCKNVMDVLYHQVEETKYVMC